MGTDNGVSYKHPKFQLEISCIVGYTKMINFGDLKLCILKDPDFGYFYVAHITKYLELIFLTAV